jgi:signal transduction histidine kinase
LSVVHIHILAPTGSDGPVTKRVLENAGFAALVCPTMKDLCDSIDETAGVLLIAEEALDDASRDVLYKTLDAQPSWSDIPVVVLTGEGELSRTLPREVTALTVRANLTLLERPVRVATLVTTLSSALRARRRQFDVRDAVEAARIAREEAEAANQAKSVFLTTMSHELRTPLNAIAGYTEILALEISGPVNEQQRVHLSRIADSERHLLALINDVLNFAKVEAGHILIVEGMIDVQAHLSGLEVFIAPQLQAKHLHYTCEAEPGLFIVADAEKLRQILLNLLSNAIKFTADRGHIAVSASGNGDHVDIAVRDDGEGVAPEKLEQIFEPFVQVGRSFNRPSEGTGLGLSISRDLARRMGGDLTLESKLGKGSTFTVRFPAAKGAREPAAD